MKDKPASTIPTTKTSNNGHKLTKKQQRILDLLSDGSNIKLTIREKAIKAGVSERYFYHTLNNPLFIVSLKNTRSYILRSGVIPVTKQMLEDSIDPNNAKRTAAQSLALEQMGLRSPQSPTVNILIDNDGIRKTVSTKDIQDVLSDE